jgi:hypothetical protein
MQSNLPPVLVDLVYLRVSQIVNRRGVSAPIGTLNH